MLIPDRSVSRVARYTWSRQWRAEACAGFVEGTLGVASFTAIRSLGAPDWIVALFVTFGQILWLAAPAWEAAFARFHIRHAFLWMGLAANVPMLFVAIVDDEAVAAGWGLWLFAGVIILAAAVDAAYVPHRSALSSANYPAAVRGRLFATLSTVSKISSSAAAKVAGFVLDSDYRWFRVLFPMAAVAGLYEHWTLSRIHWHRAGRPKVRKWGGFQSGRAAVADAWRETFRILREDRSFLVYEMGFLLYGCGFLMSNPLVTIYAESTLKLTYGEFTTASGAAQGIAYAVTILTCGRWLDRFGVVKTTAVAFTVLVFFFVAMPFVTTGNQLVACYALFGLAMALVNLGWSLGPISFAPMGKGRSYTTVHVLFVGLRSAVAPFAGLWLAREIGMRSVFAISAGLVALGAITVFRLSRTAR